MREVNRVDIHYKPVRSVQMKNPEERAKQLFGPLKPNTKKLEHELPPKIKQPGDCKLGIADVLERKPVSDGRLMKPAALRKQPSEHVNQENNP